MEKTIVNQMRESRFSKAIRNRVTKWPWYQHMPGDNLVYHYAKLKLRVLLSLFSDTLRMDSNTRKNLDITSSLKGTEDCPVLVIGNGPSAKSLTLKQITRFRSLGGKIAVMNGFADSPLSKTMIPDYYCLTDPGYWNPSNLSDFQHRERIQDLISKDPSNVTIIQPANQARIFSEHKKYIFIDGRSVAGLYRNSRPDRPWGLPGSVAMMEIATMQFLGHSVIYFTGLDSVVSRSYLVDDLNQLLWDSRGHYFYEDKAHQKDRVGLVEPGVLLIEPGLLRNFADVLYADAVFRNDLYWLMKNRCVNVGNDRTNDAAPRACLIE